MKPSTIKPHHVVLLHRAAINLVDRRSVATARVIAKQALDGIRVDERRLLRKNAEARRIARRAPK